MALAHRVIFARRRQRDGGSGGEPEEELRRLEVVVEYAAEGPSLAVPSLLDDSAPLRLQLAYIAEVMWRAQEWQRSVRAGSGGGTTAGGSGSGSGSSSSSDAGFVGAPAATRSGAAARGATVFDWSRTRCGAPRAGDAEVFLQLPTPAVVEASRRGCARGATGGNPNWLAHLLLTDASAAGHVLYGYAKAVAIPSATAPPVDAGGAAGRGGPHGTADHHAVGVLCVLSCQPLFALLRGIVGEVLAVLPRAGALEAGSVERLLGPLRDLVRPGSRACTTAMGHPIHLRIPHVAVSFLRPCTSRYLFADAPLITLLYSFSCDAVRVLYSLALQEQRVVFIGSTAFHASSCVVSMQALLAPLSWVSPLVPFVPPTAVSVLRYTEGGFLVGTTSSALPALLLERSVSDGRRSRRARAPLWIADCRTGSIGVLSAVGEAGAVPFTVVHLAPASEKLRDALRKSIARDNRHHHLAVVMSAAATSPEPRLPPLAPAVTEELHAALLEYGVHHLWGNYRKGLTLAGPLDQPAPPPPPQAASPSLPPSLAPPTGQPPPHPPRAVQGAAIDPTKFLLPNVCHNTFLVQRVISTRLYSTWESVVTAIEVRGLVQPLINANTSSGAAMLAHLRGAELGDAVGRILGDPSVAGMWGTFYSRCAKRFPELFTDTSARRDAEASPSTKKLVMHMLSKATKAMKTSLATPIPRLPVPEYIQAYASFDDDATTYADDPSKPSVMTKTFKQTTEAAAAVPASGSATSPGGYPPSPTPSFPAAARAAAAPASVATHCDAASPLGVPFAAEVLSANVDMPDWLEDVDSTAEEGGTDPSAVTRSPTAVDEMWRRQPTWPRLPLDVIHQFPYYQSRLAEPYADGQAQLIRSVEEDRWLPCVAPLFAMSPSVWPRVEHRCGNLLLLRQLVQPPPPPPPLDGRASGGAPAASASVERRRAEVTHGALPLESDLLRLLPPSTRPVVAPPNTDGYLDRKRINYQQYVARGAVAHSGSPSKPPASPATAPPLQPHLTTSGGEVDREEAYYVDTAATTAPHPLASAAPAFVAQPLPFSADLVNDAPPAVTAAASSHYAQLWGALPPPSPSHAAATTVAGHVTGSEVAAGRPLPPAPRSETMDVLTQLFPGPEPPTRAMAWVPRELGGSTPQAILAPPVSMSQPRSDRRLQLDDFF